MKKRKSYIRILLFISILLIPFYLHADDDVSDPTKEQVITFEKFFGAKEPDTGNSIRMTEDGGYVILGATSSFGKGGDDMYLIRTDENGSVLWERTYGGELEDIGTYVDQTPDGGFILFGYTSSFGEGKSAFYLVKTDSVGYKLWDKTYGGTASDYGYSAQMTEGGGYILFGHSVNPFNEGSDLYLVRTDSAGNEVWSETFDGKGMDYGYCVKQTKDGGFILLGRTVPEDEKQSHLYLLKTNEKGRKLWGMTLGMKGPNKYYPYSIHQLKNGEYVITGSTVIDKVHYMYLLKIDEIGRRIWSMPYDKRENSQGREVIETSDGGFVIVGYTKTRDPDKYDLYLIKTDSEGNMLWDRLFGSFGDDFGYSLVETPDLGFAITGSTTPGIDENEDVYFIKTDSEGNILEHIDVNTPDEKEISKEE